METKIINQNAIIAKFMQPSFNGFGTYDYNGRFYGDFELKFHSDWNWLMEVVEKISTDAMYYLALDDVKSSNWNKLQLGLKGATVGNISLVYNACLVFINWYNEQKQ